MNRIEDNTTHDFQQIYKEYYPKIHRFLVRLVGSADAGDLTQETFIKANKGLKNFRGESKLSTWLYRIAINTATDILRSKSFLVNAGKKKQEDISDSDVADEKPAAESQLIKDDMNQCIREFIDSLSSSYRTVIVLSELEGLKNREIADIIGISLDTVKIRLHRGRQKLKKKLEDGCIFYKNDQNELACDRKTGT